MHDARTVGRSRRASARAGYNRGGWAAAGVALLAGVLLVLAVFFPAFASAVRVWNQSAAHQFSYLVIPVSLYFVWLRRTQLAQLEPVADLRAVWLVIPCGVLWLVSDVAQITIGAQLAAVGMVQILALALLGGRVYRVLLFPFMFLWLLVPFGDSLLVPLMKLTSAMTVAGLTLAGLEAHADGTVLIAEARRYLVVEECAALDFIIGNLVVSLVYANLMFARWQKRCLYVLASVPVALVANAFRTTSIVVVTHLSDGQIALAYDHAAYGWFVFLLALTSQMWAGWPFRDTMQTPPVDHARAGTGASTRKLVMTWCAVAAGIVAAPGYALVTEANDTPSAGPLCWPAPLIDSDARSPRADWWPLYPGAYDHFEVHTGGELRAVTLHIAYYWRQRRGRELISSVNRVYDGRHWTFTARDEDTLTVDGRPVAVNRERLLGQGYARRSVFYWYWVGDVFTRSPLVAKLLQVKGELLSGEKRAAMIALSVEESGSPAFARGAAQAFLDQAPFGVGTLQRVRKPIDAEDSC